MILTFQLCHYYKQQEETKSEFILVVKKLSLDTTVKCILMTNTSIQKNEEVNNPLSI